MSSDSFKSIVIYKQFVHKYIWYLCVYKKNLVLKSLQEQMGHKTHLNIIYKKFTTTNSTTVIIVIIMIINKEEFDTLSGSVDY